MSASRILIVEDEPVVARDTAECLEGLGYEVLGPVASGEEAIAIAESERPDGVLMDIRLRGEMDGIEAASQIQSRFGSAVVFLTAFVDRDLLERAREAGVFGYLTKPYEERELFATLEMALAKSESELACKRARETLRKSEEQFRNIFELSADMVCIADLNGYFRVINPSFMKVLGYTQEELLGKPFLDFVHPDDKKKTLLVIQQKLEQGETIICFENRYIRSDGGTVHLEWTSRPNVAEGLTFAIARDITDRKRQEALTDALLKASKSVLDSASFEEAARAIFDYCKSLTGATSGYVALLSTDGAENEVLFLDAGGRPCSVDSELPMPIRGLRAEAYRDQKVVYDNNFSGSEWMKFMPGGHVGLDNVMFAPLVIDGRCVGLIGLANKLGDFTDEDARIAASFGELAAVALRDSRAEEALRASENKFRSLFEQAGDYILVLEPQPDGPPIIVDANEAAIEKHGFSRDEFIGKPISDLDDEENRKRLAERANRVMDGEHLVFETTHTRKDGSVFPVEVSAKLLDVHGGPPRIISIERDITERKLAENALRQSEQELHDLVYNSLNAVALHEIVLDENGAPVDYIFLRANPAFEEHTGLRVEDVLGKRVTEVHPGIVDTDLIEIYGKVALTGEPARFDTFFEPTHRYYNVTAFQAGQGRFAAVFADITKRKLAEDELKVESRMRTALLDSIPGCIAMVLRKDTRQIVASNRLAREIGAIPGQTCFKTCAARDDSCPFCLAPRMWDTYKPQRVEIEYRGTWYEGIWVPLSKDLYIHYIFDISERKRADEAIADLARFPSENPYPVLRIALDGTMLHANPAATRLLADQGLSAEGQAPDDWRSCATRAMESGDVVRREFLYGENTFALHFTPLADAGYVNVYGIDITDQKRLESQFRQAQKMEAIGRLAAGVAHDFNNQLQVILGYCDMLMMDSQQGDPLWDSLAQVLGAANNARATTSHLLSFSRRQILAPELVDAAALLREMEKPVGRMIGEDVKLLIAIPPGVWPLFIDRSGLHQALMNLAVNARDAMPSGGKLVIQGSNITLDRIQAAAYPEAVAGDYVLLEVIDSGEGMDAETLEKLFEPFFTTKEQGKGTGLGMPMVQGFVAQSKGAIRVDSQPGKGTTVRILLPQAPASAKAGKTDQAPLQIEKVEADLTILVVEDEAGVRFFLTRLLQRAGYSVLTASMPSEALELIQGDGPQPDLIVSDVIMPEMRGDEMAEKLLSIRQSLRFLFISGYGDIDVGGHEIMRKPFKSEELLERVRKLLLQNR